MPLPTVPRPTITLGGKSGPELTAHNFPFLTLFTTTVDNNIMPVPRITKEALQALLETNDSTVPVLVDVRLKYPYEHSTVTLPGAVRLAPPDFDSSSLPRNRDIVIYDSDPEEIVSARVAAALIRDGYRVSALQGGIVEWVAAKLPTDSKEAPKQKPPVAGALKG